MWTSFKFEPFKDENFDYLAKYGSDVFSQGVVRIIPSQCVLPAAYMEIAMKIKNFTVYEDDVWVISFPKCGSTLTREMVWLLMKNLDYETARNLDLLDRFPCLEFNSILLKIPQVSFAVDLCERMERPRFIKSHLPVELLPDQLWTVKPKIIYVSRNPRDAALSLYLHYRLTSHYSGTVQGFINAFLGDVIFYAPYWNHVLGFWKMRHQPNIFINTVEEMNENLPSVVSRLAAFLNKKISDEEQLTIVKHIQTYQSDRIRSRPHASSSQIQDNSHEEATDFLSQETIGRFDKWTSEALTGSEYTGPV